MIVLHEHPLGFDENGNFRTANFPYGFFDDGDGTRGLEIGGTFGSGGNNPDIDRVNDGRAKDMDRAKTDEERQAVQDHYDQQQKQMEEALAKGILKENPDGTYSE